MTKECVNCKREMLYQRKHAKFCTPTCRAKHYYLEHNKTAETVKESVEITAEVKA
jgi:hypothetical protein